MELTRSEAIRLHREMWKWIAIETLKQKRKVEKNEWFETFMPTTTVLSKCFCCEYANALNCRDRCVMCPINWHNDDKVRYLQCTNKFEPDDNKSFYGRWCNTKTWHEAVYLANKISELPEREIC